MNRHKHCQRRDFGVSVVISLSPSGPGSRLGPPRTRPRPSRASGVRQTGGVRASDAEGRDPGQGTSRSLRRRRRVTMTPFFLRRFAQDPFSSGRGLPSPLFYRESPPRPAAEWDEEPRGGKIPVEDDRGEARMKGVSDAQFPSPYDRPPWTEKPFSSFLALRVRRRVGLSKFETNTNKNVDTVYYTGLCGVTDLFNLSSSWDACPTPGLSPTVRLPRTWLLLYWSVPSLTRESVTGLSIHGWGKPVSSGVWETLCLKVFDNTVIASEFLFIFIVCFGCVLVVMTSSKNSD